MDYADLHIHTFYSDSSYSPQEVVDKAKEAGLKCIAVTDHDTVEGLPPTLLAAKSCSIEIVSGIELSCEFKERDIHILGYAFDAENKEFLSHLESIQTSRVKRMEEMVKKLHGFGMRKITLEEVLASAKGKSVGRPHLAALMVARGYVPNMRKAFDKYLADDGPIYVGKYKQTPAEAIQLIRKMGGVSVLAHPMITQVDELISAFVENGLDGLEAYYPNTPAVITEHYVHLAGKHGLLATGGSDAHGGFKPSTFIGKVKIPYALVEEIKSRARR